MIDLITSRSTFWTKAALFSVCLYISIHFLHAQSTSEAFHSEAAPMRQRPVPKKQTWQGWSICGESGIAFKTTKRLKWTKEPKYPQGSIGVLDGLGAIGLKYGRVLKNHWHVGAKVMWAFFYPDARWHISKPSWPLWLPVMYFDVGYITENNVIFSLGSFYLWSIAPSITVPMTSHWSVQVRPVLMLDKPLLGRGVHNFLINFGLSYRF